MLKLTIPKADFESLPADVKKEYKAAATGDDYELDLEGGNPAPRLKDFRDRNVKLDQDITAQKKLWEGLDPVKTREIMAKSDEIEEGKLIKKEGLEAAVNVRVEKMKTDYDAKLAMEKTRADTMERELATLRIDGGLTEELTKLNVLPEALELLTAAHRTKYKLEDGKAVAYDGDKKIYGADGNPISMRELMAAELKARPFLFKPSAGAESRGSGNQTADTGENPFLAATFNKTKQMEMLGSDDKALVAKGRRLAAAAGVKVD